MKQSDHTFLYLLILIALVWLVWGCSKASSPGFGPEIGGSELNQWLVAHPDFSARGSTVDEAYTLVSPEWVEAHIAPSTTGDCDDWAAVAWRQGLEYGRPAFGMVVINSLGDKIIPHALNFFVTPELEIWLYEPQTRKAWKAPKDDLWRLSYYWL